jgi:translation initiation factor 2 alpha subunit (eIF-2alpha)
VQPGDYIVTRVITLEPDRQRMGLSLKNVSEEDRAQMLKAREESDTVSSDDALVEEGVVEVDTA